ncbi:MAG: adenosylcobinamide-GDP ribazoletransferase [OCS116 cluster bacterium]|nr:adenosylcobinamide-GDP ribazoletransferase [OCS116 cluster bacterium]
MYNQVKSAFITLTRLPFIEIRDDDFDLRGSLWAFPIVGLVLGGILTLAASWLYRVHMDPLIACALLFLLLILMTGALHEDGLADFADSLGASSSERRLEIMRDSHIGTYGTLALIFSFAMRVYALSFVWEYTELLYIIIISLMVSRGAMVFVPIFSVPARNDGLAANFKNISIIQLLIGQSMIAIVGYYLIGNDVVYLLLIGVIVSFLVARFATAKLGGFTGDVLGATEQITQISCFVIFHLMIQY